ncbi:hypothetical protein CALVIDRAFT_217497 [Calocera viscosa TUFC12733]|uniref:Uncharacterized protein n=1 Tax=Calocera viscosa (strain TUFC12733) TaxID=1330018 RepID=A0A167RHP1_CALVF|nr:hypothetical protein CALVIDRAFT_217497 [Calocera viscosa TUFC12733]
MTGAICESGELTRLPGYKPPTAAPFSPPSIFLPLPRRERRTRNLTPPSFSSPVRGGSESRSRTLACRRLQNLLVATAARRQGPLTRRYRARIGRRRSLACGQLSRGPRYAASELVGLWIRARSRRPLCAPCAIANIVYAVTLADDEGLCNASARLGQRRDGLHCSRWRDAVCGCVVGLCQWCRLLRTPLAGTGLAMMLDDYDFRVGSSNLCING